MGYLSPAVITHLLVFLAGVLTWLPFTIWEGRRVLAPHEKKERTMWSHPLSALIRTRPPLLVTVLLVAAAMMIGFGVQQTLYQRAATERDACYEQWGRSLLETAETQQGASSRLAKAENRRDDAVDSIILTIITLRQDPPGEQRERDFDTVLARFAAAKTRLEIQQEKAGATRRQNPYPPLRCNR